MIADRTNQKLFGSWGAQNPVTAYNSHLGTAFVMWEDGLSDDDLRVLQEGGIDFVLADLRTTRNLPVYPYYYEQAEPEAGSHRTPWPLGGLQKWESMAGVDRLFDSGDIVMYDVRGLR
jgi:hypothetical protein